jgi:23S rRNA (uracil1939-C5)-methyltransferase
MEEVRIEKLVHGGQGLGELSDGRKVFVWNALPGETVSIRIIKKKRSYVEAIAEEIIVASPDRVRPGEENYLATSPWQMMTFAAENTHKKAIVEELFSREHVSLPVFAETTTDGVALGYRNKMEYSFWGDDDGLHLALYRRGSHGKQIVMGSKLALPALDAAANAVCEALNGLDVRAGDLKSVIVRVQQDGRAVACLFVKPDTFPDITLPSSLVGLKVYHSNPKSPASVATKLLYKVGDTAMHDSVCGKNLEYAVEGFFQVNIPVFERAVQQIAAFVGEQPVVDMYGGVGSISIALDVPQATIVEIDAACVAMARRNVTANNIQADVVEVASEAAVESITPYTTVIVDPPRAGLHAKVVEKLRADGPEKLVYLSCNPATHARDLKLLEEAYEVHEFAVYNFFPRTPHIETLALLRRRA